MRQAKLLLLVLVPVLVLASAPTASASGEFWIDFYLGGAFLTKADLEDKSSFPFTATAKDIKFDNSLAYGGRIGWWTGSLPWLGVALDVFHFNPDIGRQTRTVVADGLTFPGEEVTPFDISVTVIGFNESIPFLVEIRVATPRCSRGLLL